MRVTELSARLRKEGRDGKLEVVTTAVFSISIAFLILVLGMIIYDHFRKFVLYEDLYFSHLNAFPPLYSLFLSSRHPCMQDSNSSNTVLEVKDWISPKDATDSMEDEELFWRASMVPRIIQYPFIRKPKVAFMFLIRGRLFFSPLWEMFFRSHEGFFTIYVHTSPDFTYKPPRSSVFYQRQIRSKVYQSLIDPVDHSLGVSLVHVN